MEVAGLGVGVVALASLFTDCIECLEYIEAGRSLEHDCNILLTKLAIQKHRLLIWGECYGIATHRPDAPRASAIEVIEQVLVTIKDIFHDIEKMETLYGCRKVEALENGSNTQLTQTTIFPRRREAQLRPLKAADVSVKSKFKWAIRDKTKFSSLIANLKDLVDGLNSVTPEHATRRQETMVKDIVSIFPDVGSLRYIREACEDEHSNWSAMADMMIDVSDRFSEDARIFEWMDCTSSVSPKHVSVWDGYISESSSGQRPSGNLVRSTKRIRAINDVFNDSNVSTQRLDNMRERMSYIDTGPKDTYVAKQTRRSKIHRRTPKIPRPSSKELPSIEELDIMDAFYRETSPFGSRRGAKTNTKSAKDDLNPVDKPAFPLRESDHKVSRSTSRSLKRSKSGSNRTGCPWCTLTFDAGVGWLQIRDHVEQEHPSLLDALDQLDPVRPVLRIEAEVGQSVASSDTVVNAPVPKIIRDPLANTCYALSAEALVKLPEPKTGRSWSQCPYCKAVYNQLTEDTMRNMLNHVKRFHKNETGDLFINMPFGTKASQPLRLDNEDAFPPLTSMATIEPSFSPALDWSSLPRRQKYERLYQSFCDSDGQAHFASFALLFDKFNVSETEARRAWQLVSGDTKLPSVAADACIAFLLLLDIDDGVNNYSPDTISPELTTPEITTNDITTANTAKLDTTLISDVPTEASPCISASTSEKVPTEHETKVQSSQTKDKMAESKHKAYPGQWVHNLRSVFKRIGPSQLKAARKGVSSLIPRVKRSNRSVRKKAVSVPSNPIHLIHVAFHKDAQMYSGLPREWKKLLDVHCSDSSHSLDEQADDVKKGLPAIIITEFEASGDYMAAPNQTELGQLSGQGCSNDLTVSNVIAEVTGTTSIAAPSIGVAH